MNRLVGLITRYPVAIVVAFTMVCGLSVWGYWQRAHFDFSFETMAPRGTPEFAAFKEFVATFGDDTDTLFVIAFRDSPLLSNDNLRLIDRITLRIEALDATESVSSLTNVLDLRGSQGGLEISPFVEKLPLGEAELTRLKHRFISDSLVAGNLISRDGSTAALVGRMVGWSSDPLQRLEYFAEVEKILAEEGRGRVEFHIAGLPYMDRTLISHINHDTSVFMPLTLVIFSVLLWAAFRRVRAVWMPVAAIGIAATLTIGSMAGLGVPMTLLTGQGVLATLIMVIGLSNAVHLMNRYEEDLIRLPAITSPYRALSQTVRHMGAACFLTSTTTALAFASLALSSIPTIRDFGIFGALGVMYAYAATVVFLPATTVLMERLKAPAARPVIVGDRLSGALNMAADVVLRHSRSLVVGGVAVLLLTAAAIPLVHIDNRYSQDLKSDDPAVLSLKFLEEHLGGAFNLPIVFAGGQPDSMKNPRVLELMEKVRVGLESHPHVSKVISPSEFIMKMNQAMNDGDPGAYRLPDSQAAVAQYLLLFSMAGSDAEFERLVDYNYSTAIVMALTAELSPTQYQEVVDALHAIVDGNEGLPAGIRVYESGVMPLFNTVSRRLVETLVRSLYVAMPVIFIITGLAFRSVRVGLLTILPNLIPITVGMGLLGITGISLRFATIVAFPLAFGLAIDDTIHFLVRYRSELERGNDEAAAVRKTLATAGRAMVLTTVFLIAGYSVMFASNFVGLIHMALIISVILGAALFGDLLVLPALLLIFKPDLIRTDQT